MFFIISILQIPLPVEYTIAFRPSEKKSQWVTRFYHYHFIAEKTGNQANYLIQLKPNDSSLVRTSDQAFTVGLGLSLLQPRCKWGPDNSRARPMETSLVTSNVLFLTSPPAGIQPADRRSLRPRFLLHTKPPRSYVCEQHHTLVHSASEN